MVEKALQPIRGSLIDLCLVPGARSDGKALACLPLLSKDEVRNPGTGCSSWAVPDMV